MGHRMKFGESFVEQLKVQASTSFIVVQDTCDCRKVWLQLHRNLPVSSGKERPSFHVRQSPAYYYCFGCGAKGDAIGFVQNMERISFPETVKLLAE